MVPVGKRKDVEGSAWRKSGPTVKYENAPLPPPLCSQITVESPPPSGRDSYSGPKGSGTGNGASVTAVSVDASSAGSAERTVLPCRGFQRVVPPQCLRLYAMLHTFGDARWPEPHNGSAAALDVVHELPHARQVLALSHRRAEASRRRGAQVRPAIGSLSHRSLAPGSSADGLRL
mmetsp:Transcript_19665/g.61613  ORF Transcript_19665/g.61613 Transcript_19665/m.61613 type:complete len:175 (+) Transcript_19665:505-1029(+)